MGIVNIVIPTYNEAENLPTLINMLEETLTKDILDTIIIIDDNSPDKTAIIAEEMNQRYKNIVIRQRLCKLGIGNAVRDGLKMALSLNNCVFIITMDADLSHHPTSINRLLSEAKNADLVLGSRYVKGGKIIGWTFYRRTVSLFANMICRLLLRTGLHDHTTNFRVYSRKCAEIIVANTHSNKNEWFIETVIVAKDNNFTIKEVPVTFTNRMKGETKLNISNIFVWGFYTGRAFLERLLNKRSSTS